MKKHTILALLAAGSLSRPVFRCHRRRQSHRDRRPRTAETTAGTTAPAVTWQTFTNVEAGFSLQAPSTWSQQTLPDQNAGAIHGMASPARKAMWKSIGGWASARLPDGDVQSNWRGRDVACHATNTDGTQTWSQIGYQVSAQRLLGARLHSNAEPSSHDMCSGAGDPHVHAACATAGGAEMPIPLAELHRSGGTVSFEERGDDGQYGVCTFEDNQQCEEWALMRGDCPVGASR